MHFDQVHVSARDGAELYIPDWRCEPDEVWTVLGGNGSGKSLLARTLYGDLTPRSGRIDGRPEGVHWLSLEQQQALYERELYDDDTDFSDHLDPGHSVRELMTDIAPWSARHDAWSEALGLTDVLDRGYRLLSSGEGRKVMLARALLAQPRLLILDEPFEGLDRDARADLLHTLERLVADGQWLMLLINQRQDIPPWATHLALLDRHRLTLAGPVETVARHPDWQAALDLSRIGRFTLPVRPEGYGLNGEDPRCPLVRLRDGQVVYAEGVQFQGLDWDLMPGEHTQLIGPNGCGKSTLLSLISGDHPQCYSNDLTVFGYRRGRGESIWDIKKHLGLVSGHLHRDYRVSGNAVTTVVSGLTDSIGLYQAVGQAEIDLAHQWLDTLGLGDRSGTAFRALSTGEQRLVLMARALIKQPPLLILDEPTQGLDDVNRFRVLAAVERVIEQNPTTLLFVSHREDERPAVIQRQLRFVSDGEEARYRIVMQ